MKLYHIKSRSTERKTFVSASVDVVLKRWSTCHGDVKELYSICIKNKCTYVKENFHNFVSVTGRFDLRGETHKFPKALSSAAKTFRKRHLLVKLLQACRQQNPCGISMAFKNGRTFFISLFFFFVEGQIIKE